MKDIVKNEKESHRSAEKFCKKKKSSKRLLSKIHKELLKFNNKKTKIQLKKTDKRSELAPHQRKYTDGK